MTVSEGLPVALFCIATVFVVLGCLFIIIKLFSLALGLIENIGNKPEQTHTVALPTHSPVDKSNLSSGELKLYDVDEQTAAIIMAIVSHESGIPLSNLFFKSIKNIEKTTL